MKLPPGSAGTPAAPSKRAQQPASPTTPIGAAATGRMTTDGVTLSAEAGRTASKEKQLAEVLEDGPRGLVGEAVSYWQEQAERGGAVGRVMGGLLAFSGLPQVERSAQELGARVGLGDSRANIAKSAGKLTFHSALFALNGWIGGKAIASAGQGAARAVGLARAGQAALPTVVRHYTSRAAAQAIMDEGVLYASKAGSSGFNKIYFTAEKAGEAGLNVLRRLNIGQTAAQTSHAIEINLAKLGPEAARAFHVEATRGALNLENFVTHVGALDLKAIQGAVRVVEAGQLPVAMDQLLHAGGQLASYAGGFLAADRAAETAAR